MSDDELPSIVEHGKDIQSSDNYKNTFSEHIRRLLLLLVNSPDDKFPNGLAGLEVLLEPYKDTKYLEDVQKNSIKLRNAREKMVRANVLGGSDSENDNKELIFNFNLEMFKALIRLSGRANMLPIPNVTLMAGGGLVKMDVTSEEVNISTDEIESIEDNARKIVDEKRLKEELEKEERLKKRLKEKKLKDTVEEAKPDDLGYGLKKEVEEGKGEYI